MSAQMEIIDKAVMKAASPNLTADPPRGRILHIAGVITEGVFSFLGPATTALDRAGYAQTLVTLDASQHRYLMSQFPAGIDIHLIPMNERDRRHWLLMYQLIRESLSQHAFAACHIHGFLPWALGSRMGRALPRGMQIFYSPHGSRSLGWLSPLQHLMGKAMAMRGQALPAVIATHGREARLSAWDPGQDVISLDIELNATLFELPRRESRRPLLLAGSIEADSSAVERFCRIAVLLSADELKMAFNWVGHLSDYTQNRLKAANVGAHSLKVDEDLWVRLSSAWIYVATGESREFPLVMATAMAMGIPCVAVDSSRHRDLIEHGVNGFLYQTSDEAMAHICHLVDNPHFRHGMGQAAREGARKRWAPGHLDDAIIRIYQEAMSA